ncbi:MAG: hypothetical protein H6708_15270 [Kofleriaceae bacterium]|nr:hypothetical protein [Kofleriaceae bacterium]
MAAPDSFEHALAAARVALPDVEVADAAIRAALDARGGALAHVADLLLALGCAAGQAAAVRRFDDLHVARIASWLAPIERDAAVIDEVRQRVRTRALVGDADRAPRIADYSARGPLGAWVRVIALREHANIHRDAARDPAGDGDDALVERATAAEPSPELAALRGRYLPLMSDAVRAALRALPPRDRTLMRLAYVDGLALDAIGRMYAVNKSTVSRWLAGARAQVVAATIAHVRAELHASEAEAESLLGLVRSSLELSLPGLL